MWLPLYYFYSSYIGAVKVYQKYRMRLELLENLSKFMKAQSFMETQKTCRLCEVSDLKKINPTLKVKELCDKEIFPVQKHQITQWKLHTQKK